MGMKQEHFISVQEFVLACEHASGVQNRED